MTAAAPTPAFLRDEIARLSEMIGLARQLIAMGGAVNLDPVGEGIKALCGAVATLPPDQGKTLRGDLQALSDRLEKLGADIETHMKPAEQSAAPPVALP